MNDATFTMETTSEGRARYTAPCPGCSGMLQVDSVQVLMPDTGTSLKEMLYGADAPAWFSVSHTEESGCLVHTAVEEIGFIAFTAKCKLENRQIGLHMVVEDVTEALSKVFNEMITVEQEEDGKEN